jgi:hypothetical protein
LQERIGYLLTRPVGRPSLDVRRRYAKFTYQAGSWTKPRRVVAKVEWHPDELYPRVGFIVTNMARPAENVVAFYNKRGACEQWIKEGKGAIRSTRLSCRSFAANAVRLQLYALAYNLRTLATPEPIKDWSLTSLKEKLIKIGAKVVSHGRYVAFQMAEVAIPRNLFADILRLIAELRPPPVASTVRGVLGCHAFVKTHRRRVVLVEEDLAFRTFGAASAGLDAVRRRTGGSQTASSRLSGAQNRRRFGLSGAPSGGCGFIMADQDGGGRRRWNQRESSCRQCRKCLN